MSPSQLLQENLQLVVTRDPDLMQLFYGRLFDRYPQTKALFRRNGKEEQARMLSEAVAALVDRVDDPEFVRDSMLDVGRRHLDYGVEDHMYAWLGECLLETMKQVSAEAWNEELEAAWAKTLDEVIGIAIEGANALRKQRANAT